MPTRPETRPPLTRSLDEKDVPHSATHEIIKAAIKEAEIIGYKIVSYAVTSSNAFVILRAEIRESKADNMRGTIMLWRDSSGRYFEEINFG
jgi:hypothetical protein